MNKLYKTITVSIMIPGIIVAAHLALDPSKKVDFEKARLAMIKNQLQAKQLEEQSLQQKISLHNDQLLVNQLKTKAAELQKEISTLGHDVTVSENSIKALIAIK